MDEIAHYNSKRWKALAEANALFTRPFFHLTTAEAAEQLDPEGRLGELTGKNVLCLAGGGGHASGPECRTRNVGSFCGLCSTLVGYLGEISSC